jgi:hypothetical protein
MESNHPTVGLPRPAGFEDRIGHRPGAAPLAKLARCAADGFGDDADAALDVAGGDVAESDDELGRLRGAIGSVVAHRVDADQANGALCDYVLLRHAVGEPQDGVEAGGHARQSKLGRVVLNFGPGNVSGEVTTWQPPSALGFTWEASNMPGVRLHVSFTVDDLGDGRSRVNVVHSGFEGAPAEAREAVVGGWAHFLPRLADVVREESR